MKKLLLALLVIVMVIHLFLHRFLADTGTYKIDNYNCYFDTAIGWQCRYQLLSAVDCFIRKYSLDYSRAAEYFLYQSSAAATTSVISVTTAAQVGCVISGLDRHLLWPIKVSPYCFTINDRAY